MSYARIYGGDFSDDSEIIHVRPTVIDGVGGGQSPDSTKSVLGTRNLLSWIRPTVVYRNTTDKITKDVSAASSQCDKAYYKFATPYIAPIIKNDLTVYDRFIYRYNNLQAWNGTTGFPIVQQLNISSIIKNYDDTTMNYNNVLNSRYIRTLRTDKTGGAGVWDTQATSLTYEWNRTTNRKRTSGSATLSFQDDVDFSGTEVVHIQGVGGSGYNGRFRLKSASGKKITYDNAGADESSTADTGGYFADDPVAYGQDLIAIYPSTSTFPDTGSTQSKIYSFVFSPLTFADNELVGLYAYAGTDYSDARKIIANSASDKSITVNPAFSTPIVLFSTKINIVHNVYGMSLDLNTGANSDQVSIDDLVLNSYARNTAW